MANEPAPFPLDDLHAAAPDAAEHIDGLHAELQSGAPDGARIAGHVETLRGHGGIKELFDSWYRDERTQAFIGELSGLGL
jgi:hypothetical protein